MHKIEIMKLYAHHNAEGTMSSIIVVNAPKGVTLSLRPQDGMFASEIEGTNMKIDELDIDKLREIANNYKVEKAVSKLIKTKKS